MHPGIWGHRINIYREIMCFGGVWKEKNLNSVFGGLRKLRLLGNS